MRTKKTPPQTLLPFSEVNSRALPVLPDILSRWLPEGKIVGNEYIALNPKREDENVGSFRINLNTGRWADFATGDRGNDIISLAAYLFDIRQGDAKFWITKMLGVKSWTKK